jgi:hypothetical protein
MKRVIFGCVVLSSMFALSGCGGSAKPAPGTGCALNSDCATGLICTFALCHSPCVKDTDCATGQMCVKSSAVGDGGTINVCQLPAEAHCYYNSMCMAPLVCGRDETCRNQCQSSIDCVSGEVCTSSGVCALPSDLVKGTNDVTLLTTGRDGGYDAFASGTGAGGAAGSSATGTGGSATGTGGSAGATGTGGAGGGPTCTAMTRFGRVATGASNPNYTTGIGVKTATELLVFSGYVGPPATDGGTDGDAGVGTYIGRVDVQHFDLSTGASKGPPSPLFNSMATGVGLFAALSVNGVAVAPGGQIAVIYEASSATTGGQNAWAVYLTFLDASLAVEQTTQLDAVGFDLYHQQSHVQWLNGTFIASWLPQNGPLKIASYDTDGSPADNAIIVPTNDPSGFLYNASEPDGDLAFSGNVLATTYIAFGDYSGDPFTQQPALTLLEPTGTQVGSALRLPYGIAASPLGVAGTAQGFVAVYNGADNGDGGSDVDSVLATIVSATGTVGQTYSFPGGYTNTMNNFSVRGASDGSGAAFSLFYPDGSVSFLYMKGDGSKPANPQPILQQQNPATVSDQCHLTNLAGGFTLSLFSNAEHLTRVATSACP